MARTLRLERAGAWYHVTARGNERKAIYRADADRRRFLELLSEWRERFRCRLYAYVLMENHYHLRWAEFRDRRGDWGRELALYLGRQMVGLTLAELSRAVEGGSAMAVSVALEAVRCPIAAG